MRRFANYAVTILVALSASPTVYAGSSASRPETSANVGPRDSIAILKVYRQQQFIDLLLAASRPQPLIFMGQSLTGFWADQNPSLQSKIDRGYELILSTSTGRGWVRSLLFNSSLIGQTLATSCRPDKVRIENGIASGERAQSEIAHREDLAEQLTFFWGLSLSVARKMVGAPANANSNLAQRSVSLHYADGRTIALLPKLYFLSRVANNTRIDSYTAADNKTIVMISDTQNPDSQLIGVLAHEAAITGDAKSDLLTWASQRSYRDLPEWQTKLADPAFNSIFATMRAFRTETLVFSDLARSESEAGSGTRTDAWAIEPELQPYVALNPQSCLQEYQRLLRAKYLTGLGVADHDRVELLKFLDIDSTITRCDGTRVNACMEFATIETGARVQNSSGPRPRVGSDW